MIVGVGTDLVEISRIQQVLERAGDGFARRVLTPTEFTLYAQHRFSETYLAKRWAAKEAVAKALGTGIAQGVSFQDLHIDREASGKPVVRLSGQALMIADSLKIQSWHLSISDEKHYAVAFAIAES